MKMRFRYLGQVNLWTPGMWTHIFRHHNVFSVKVLRQPWAHRRLITITILGVGLFFEVAPA